MGRTDPAPSPDAASTSECAAPIVTVDPLKADCAKVLTTAQLWPAFGQLPAGTDRIGSRPANPGAEITGRLKCQYGVDGDKSAIAVQVVLAQFDDRGRTPQAQMRRPRHRGGRAGAKTPPRRCGATPPTSCSATADCSCVGYDTWTLSVVVADRAS